MRLQLIQRISLLWTAIFCGVLAVVQLLEGTPPFFVTCTALFILISTAAFNIAGGLTTLPGAYIFFCSVLTGIFGLVLKAILGEPGQSNLQSGEELLSLYVVSSLGMLVAACIERKLRPQHPLLTSKFRVTQLRPIYWGAAVVGLLGGVYRLSHSSGEPGSLTALLLHFDQFTPYAIIVGTMFVVSSSEGRSCISPFLAFLILVSTAEGFLYFSKEIIFAPIAAWILGLVGSRYRIRLIPALGFLVFFGFLIKVGVPWAQWGRTFRDQPTAIDVLPTAIYLAKNFDVVQQGYAESDEVDGPFRRYFTHDVGQAERLCFITVDDALVSFTDIHGPLGIFPTRLAVESLVPHILWRDKPDVAYGGNYYARELGGNPYDTTTGISIGIVGDSYRQGAVFGVAFLEPFVLTCVFLLFSFLLGKVNEHPANLVMVLLLGNIAPEQGLSSLVRSMIILMPILGLGFVSKYVFSPIGSLLPQSRKISGHARGLSAQQTG